MFDLLLQTLTELCADSTSAVRGARADDLHKAMKGKGYTMNDATFGATLFEWDRFEQHNEQRVTFHCSSSSRGKTYSYGGGIDTPGFNCGAISLR